jgi:hypothetical protein
MNHKKQLVAFEGEGVLPVYSRFASSATHLSGLFLPQRDPEMMCADAHE